MRVVGRAADSLALVTVIRVHACGLARVVAARSLFLSRWDLRTGVEMVSALAAAARAARRVTLVNILDRMRGGGWGWLEKERRERVVMGERDKERRGASWL